MFTPAGATDVVPAPREPIIHSSLTSALMNTLAFVVISAVKGMKRGELDNNQEHLLSWSSPGRLR